MYTLVSSAKSQWSILKISGISLINNVGPRTLPWGTPLITATSSEHSLPTLTFWVFIYQKVKSSWGVCHVYHKLSTFQLPNSGQLKCCLPFTLSSELSHFFFLYRTGFTQNTVGLIVECFEQVVSAVISKGAVNNSWGILSPIFSHKCRKNHPNRVISSEKTHQNVQ